MDSDDKTVPMHLHIPRQASKVLIQSQWPDGSKLRLATSMPDVLVDLRLHARSDWLHTIHPVLIKYLQALHFLHDDGVHYYIAI